MAIELTVIISVVSIGIAAVSLLANINKNNRQITKDTSQEVEERASMNARVMTKLDAISDDLREIKKDNSDLRKDLNHLSDRVLICEQKLQFGINGPGVNYASSYVEKADQ